MHIKTIRVDNFKSYRGLNIVEGFDKGLNVIVGKNGSGKSNVFFAVQFVLSDEFEYLRTEERLKIINEAPGEPNNSAFVEIVFDNNDNRIPINQNEVIFRRQITLKNDSYAINGRIVTKNELNSLLESAGFSKSNPYYIVKQGKISKLVAAKDKERLELLLEIAGANVYDQRKVETCKLLVESNSKLKEIEVLLENYNSKIDNLQIETDQFMEYKNLTLEKSCIEYMIHDKIINDCRAKLDEVESERVAVIENKKKLHDELEKIKESTKNCSNDLKSVIEKYDLSKQLNSRLNDYTNILIKEKTEIELLLNDLKSNFDYQFNTDIKIKEELVKVTKKANVESSDLIPLKEKLAKIKLLEDETLNKIEKNEDKKAQIYLRLKQKDNFRSAKERDAWLQTQIEEYGTLSKNRNNQLRTLNEDIKSFKEQIRSLQIEIESREMNVKNFKKTVESLNLTKLEFSKKKDELEIKKKELWRDEATLNMVFETIKSEFSRTEKAYSLLVPKTVLTGIESINNLVKDHGLKGVLGTLIDNMKCDEPFYIPIEVAAGSRLYNIIVENDETASKLIKMMNSKSLNGQVTFIPLNRVKFTNLSRDCLSKNEVIELHNKIEFNDKIKNAILHVFGKCLLAKNADVANRVSEDFNVDCVTMDGYYKSYKGTIFGGHYNTSKSRLRLRANFLKCQKVYQQKENELKDIQNKIYETDKQIHEVLNEIQQINIKIDQNNDANERHKGDLKNANNQLSSLELNLTNKLNVLKNIEHDLERFQNLIFSFEEEKSISFSKDILKETQQIERLNEELLELKSRCEKLTLERIELQNTVKNSEIDLNDNLGKKCFVMQHKIDESELENIKSEVTQKQKILQMKKQALEAYKGQLADNNLEIERLKLSRDSFQSQLEILRSRESNMIEMCAEHNLSINKLINFKNNIINKREESLKKKAQLGLIRPDDLNEYSNMSTKNAWKRIEAIQEKLKALGNLNENAMEQYMKFSSEKTELNKRKGELDESSVSIRNLISVLDEQKQNAVLLTFKQVSVHFSETFKEIVPNGTAYLAMKRDKPIGDKPNNSSFKDDWMSINNEVDNVTNTVTTDDRRSTLDSVSGVSIKVNFNSTNTDTNSETYDMNQLSGGQKALLALTLIFAIQKCDPAPFFLFDEIDQALDPQYRQAVAQVIKRLSDKAQFIATTFRRDLVTYSQRTFGVKCINRSSHIQQITNDLALDFINKDEPV